MWTFEELIVSPGLSLSLHPFTLAFQGPQALEEFQICFKVRFISPLAVWGHVRNDNEKEANLVANPHSFCVLVFFLSYLEFFSLLSFCLSISVVSRNAPSCAYLPSLRHMLFRGPAIILRPSRSPAESGTYSLPHTPST